MTALRSRDRLTKTAALVSIAMLVGAAACGSRVDHAQLLADAAGSTAQQLGSPGATGTAIGGSTPTASAQAGVTGPGPIGGTAATTSAAARATTGTGGAAPTAAKTCTKQLAPVVIGTVGVQSGVAGKLLGEGPAGTQVWVQHINQQGGVNCHPVKYIILDDGGDPARHQVLIRQLVEQQKAIAIVMCDCSLTGQASVDYLTQHQIPVIGGSGAEPWFYTSPVYFPAAPTGPTTFAADAAATGTVARSSGKKKVTVMACIETDVCQLDKNAIVADAAKDGYSIVSTIDASLVQPDFTAACQKAQSDGADIFWIIMEPASIQRVGRSCASVGYHPQYMAVHLLANDALKNDPNLQGIQIPMTYRPWIDTSNKNVLEYRNAFQQLSPGGDLGAGTEVGWVAAKLFELAAANVSDPPTSANILAGLWAIKDNDLGGLTYPLSFARNQNPPMVSCYWLIQEKAKQWVSTDGFQRTCL